VVAAAVALWGPRGSPAPIEGSLDWLAQRAHRDGCALAMAGLEGLAAGTGLESLRAAYLLGWCLAAQGRHAAAALAFRAASAHPTLRPHAQLEQAGALTRSGRAAAAAGALSALAATTGGRLRGRVWLALGRSGGGPAGRRRARRRRPRMVAPWDRRHGRRPARSGADGAGPCRLGVPGEPA
jgi:hypothetical protein